MKSNKRPDSRTKRCLKKKREREREKERYIEDESMRPHI